MESKCSKCSMRVKFDKNPKSFVGRFWRWHINFCPGWKAYFTSLPLDEQAELRKKYTFTKYNSTISSKD